MKRLAIVILLLLTFTLAPQAQQRRKQSTVKKTTVATSKKSKASKSGKSTKSGKSKKSGNAATSNIPSVQSLKNQRLELQQQIKHQEHLLVVNKQDVSKRLQTLMVINSEIEGKRRSIDTIRRDIGALDEEIELLGIQLEQLKKQLEDCKRRYVKSMRYMHRNRSAQSQLMFIFSADNFMQMFRRMRFMKEYAAYQHVQGDEIKTQQEVINQKYQELDQAKSHKKELLAKDERERRSLEGKQVEQQNVVKTLQKEQKSIQNIIAQQKKKDAALNAQIDRLIAEEVARQKARAAAEAKRRAEEARRREAEQARKRADEERVNANTGKSSSSKTSKKSGTTAKSSVKTATTPSDPPLYTPSEDMRISGNFESNKGRLPMPITGGYRIVSRFGQYNVEGLHNVTLDNKGINIKGEPGAQARSIFDGEVSAVFSFGGTMVVMVRHGSYISVYCNLASVNVHRGQKVSTRQALGRIGQDSILQFQLRRETTKLNPESWLGR